jgi:hypothetical protein
MNDRASAIRREKRNGTRTNRNRTDSERQRSPGDDGSPEALAANPRLSDDQLARLRAYGSPDDLDIGAAFASPVGEDAAP